MARSLIVFLLLLLVRFPSSASVPAVAYNTCVIPASANYSAASLPSYAPLHLQAIRRVATALSLASEAAMQLPQSLARLHDQLVEELDPLVQLLEEIADSPLLDEADRSTAESTLEFLEDVVPGIRYRRLLRHLSSLISSINLRPDEAHIGKEDAGADVVAFSNGVESVLFNPTLHLLVMFFVLMFCVVRPSLKVQILMVVVVYYGVLIWFLKTSDLLPAIFRWFRDRMME